MADFQWAENVYTSNNAYENSPKVSEFAFCRSESSLIRVENTNQNFSCRGLSYQGKRIFLQIFFLLFFAVSDLESVIQKRNKRWRVVKASAIFVIKTTGQSPEGLGQNVTQQL